MKPLFLCSCLVISSCLNLWSAKAGPGDKEQAVNAEEAGETGQAGQKKRRILVLEFDNQQKVEKFEYLRGTISDSVARKLEKTGKYDVVTLEKLVGKSASEITALKNRNLYQDDIALGLGVEADADIVVTGNFGFLGDEVLIQAKALDVNRSLLFTTTADKIKTDNQIFNSIGQVADRVVERVEQKVKAWDAEDAMIERSAERWAAEPYFVSLHVHYALPQGDFADALAGGVNFKGFGSYRFIFFDPVSFNLAAQLSYVSHGEVESFPTSLSYHRFSTWLGAELGYNLPTAKLMSLHVFLMGGYVISSLERGLDNSSYSGRDSALTTGLEYRYTIWRRLAVTAQVAFERVMFTGSKVSYLTLGSGVGYRF